MTTNPHNERWLSLVLDEGWSLDDDELRSRNPLAFPGYSPGPESVTCASGTASGFPVELILFDFEVLGGTLGVVAGENIARAFERAVVRRAGVVALIATGGARMQEGMAALVQMPKTVVARQTLAKHGLPFVAYLRNPSTGGVYVSFAALADILWAEPRATIGFAGPRVAEQASGSPLPAGSHTAEFALASGLIDGIVAPETLGDRVRAFLDLALGQDSTQPAPAMPPAPASAVGDAWDEVGLARHPNRPTGRDFAEKIVGGLVELSGDRAGTSDVGALLGLGRVAGRRTAVIAHARRPLPPAAFRASQRTIRLAARFGLPVVTFIDTPGADPRSESERGGIARAIAGTFREVLEHARPVVAVVTGEGGSGGALAFASADRLLALEHSIFSVIAPESAATILRRDDAATMARDLKPTSADLKALGIADHVIAEPAPGAHEHPDATARLISDGIAAALAEADGDGRTARLARWRGAASGFLESS